jgi:hypothetical protein
LVSEEFLPHLFAAVQRANGKQFGGHMPLFQDSLQLGDDLRMLGGDINFLVGVFGQVVEFDRAGGLILRLRIGVEVCANGLPVAD